MRPLRSRFCDDCGKVFEARVARYCEKCRHDRKSRPSPKRKWFLTEDQLEYMRKNYDSRVRGRVDKLAEQFGVPSWWLKKKAGHMGLSKMTTGDRKPWSADEIALLTEWAGRRSLEHIRKRWFPHRSFTSVAMACRRLKLSRAPGRDGYTMGELCLALGCDHRLVTRWVKEGRLKAAQVGAMHDQCWVFHPAAVVRFMRENPTGFRLDKVDQLWFMDLVFGTEGIGAEAKRQALAA